MTKKVLESIDEVIAQVMIKITEAANKHDLSSIETLSRAASELKEIKERVSHVGARLARTNSHTINPHAASVSTTTRFTLRELKIEITEGAIRQNLLTMTESINKGLVKPDEQFIIEALPSGERFVTVLLSSGNKLQERGAISRFYRDAHVQGGDFVLLKEIAPGEWTLSRFLSGNN